MKRIYSRQLEKRRTGNFKMTAIAKIKKETTEAERLASEKNEEERKKSDEEKRKANEERTTAASNNAFSHIKSESEIGFDSLIATSDLVLKA